jgi:hypothetical protein
MDFVAVNGPVGIEPSRLLILGLDDQSISFPLSDRIALIGRASDRPAAGLLTEPLP